MVGFIAWSCVFAHEVKVIACLEKVEVKAVGTHKVGMVFQECDSLVQALGEDEIVVGTERGVWSLHEGKTLRKLGGHRRGAGEHDVAQGFSIERQRLCVLLRDLRPAGIEN